MNEDKGFFNLILFLVAIILFVNVVRKFFILFFR
jgi:hypothetical protein